ncbi:hypothetical protein [Janthinobacterium svalbardensis]|uniref:hypothetical protein n=1 Tax=Janthinobacterium svalbardensis TaxID=368607 RepID=UPI002FCDA36B
MNFFEEYDLAHWFERCMLLAMRRTPNLKFNNSGDATFTALAANFLSTATTVILDREGVKNKDCVVYGANKGNLAFAKVKEAGDKIARAINSFGVSPENSDLIIKKIAELDDKEGLYNFLVRNMALTAEKSQELIAKIYKNAHPARIALDAACSHWGRQFEEREYLVDFSVHSGSKVIVTMESEGKYVTSECPEGTRQIPSDTIYWDFFKLLNVSSKYKFLLAVENKELGQDNVRKSLKKFLDAYVEQNEGSILEEQIWIFIFHPTIKNDRDSSLPGFDMYVVEHNIIERRKFCDSGIESFLSQTSLQE